MTDNGCQVIAKAHFAFGKVSLKLQKPAKIHFNLKYHTLSQKLWQHKHKQQSP